MKPGLVFALMIAVTFVSAIAVVAAKHQSRRLFAESQELIRETDRLNIEWNMLQLEQAAWSAHGRIEQLARERLHMRVPRRSDVVILRQ